MGMGTDVAVGAWVEACFAETAEAGAEGCQVGGRYRDSGWERRSSQDWMGGGGEFVEVGDDEEAEVGNWTECAAEFFEIRDDGFGSRF